MAPKRKKKDAGGTKSLEPAAKKDNSDDKDPLAILLTNIQQISKLKNRCTDLLQAFHDDACTVLHEEDTSNNKQDHVDCYWILLATHYIERMVQYLEKQKEDCVTVLLAAMSHALAMTLYSDKSKLEKCAGKSGAVRSALGRAIMSVTIGSTSALQHLGNDVTDDDLESASLIRRAAWSALTALEIVVNHSLPKTNASSSSSDGWNHAQFWLWQDAADLDIENQQDLLEVCQAASHLLEISKEEHACLEALVGKTEDAQAPPTPSKRRRAARKDNDVPSSAISAHFKPLMENQGSIMIDGRVSVRRWASMTFVWFCQGQQRLLDLVDNLLTNTEYWDSVLDCPAVIGLKEAPPPKKSLASRKKGGKRSAAAAAEPVQASPPVHIPGNVSTVALASCLIAIVSETGTTCGIRAPTGGMDTYAAHVLGLDGNTGKGRGRAAAAAASVAESLPAWKRPDVRNLASVVIYKLVQAHTSCLRKNCTSPEAFGCVLVNDDSSTGFAASVPMGATRPLFARFYPTVYKSVKSLCSAAANSGDDSTNTSDSTKRLLGIASAFILASGEQIRNIVDAKLYGVAIGQLSDCLRSIISDDDRSNGPRAIAFDPDEDEEARHSRLIEKYNLVDPLPTPNLLSTKPTRKRKKKKLDDTQESSVCTFGGMFPQDTTTAGQQQNMSDEELLSFLIRAVQSSSDESPPSAMFTELIEIVRCCYDLKEPSSEVTTEDFDVGSKRKGRKRSAPSKASQGKRKRKKVSTEAGEVSQGDESAGKRTPKNMMSPRATLATDSLNALRMMVSHIPPTSSANRSRRELREFLREALTTEQICSIVDLNRMINEALIESHVAMKAAQETSVSENASSTFFSASPSGSFRPYEKLLWSAHIKLCDTIGKGQSIYDKSKEGLLGDSNQRLTIFRAVAASSKRKAPVDNASKSTSVPERWPLSLPPAQHALVVSSLTSNPIQGQDDFSPELFITRSFMSSITDALGDSSMLRAAEWHKSFLEFIGSETVAADDDVPLSLRDARLFVLAVTRLPRNEQMKFLKSFVGAVSSAVCKIKSVASHSALFEEDADVSGFLARVVTTCASLVNLVTVGSSLRAVFVTQVYPSHYAIPTLVAVDDMKPSKRLREFDWYRKDSSFVSLFSDWESPVVPNVAGTVNMNIEVTDELVSNLRALHESSIQLGFASAKVDRCHLLFSAWNASGRQATWDKKSVSHKVNSLATDEANATRRLLELREDVCLVNQELLGNESLVPNSLLTRILKERSSGRSAPTQLRSKLESMIAKAEALVNSILSSNSSSERLKDPPLVSFALLEALPTYIAFVMAAHTRPDENILLRESGRANNAYDEDSVSSAEDYADERVDILMRLNDACDAVGAAPFHPDWLDDGCSLRDGITADDATRLAHRAMTCLENLLSAAREEYIKSSSRALSSSIVTEANCEQLVEVALKLCISRVGANTTDDTNTGEGEATSISARLDEAIASLCGLETWQVKLFSKETNCMNFSHASEKSFCKHAIQTILGSMHTRHESFEGWDPTPAEYRVCGDWEYLLSESLLSASCNVDFPEEIPPSNEFRQAFHTVIRWARIQKACTTHLMPVAALLRFGLSGGVGRQRHPLLNPVIDGGEDIKLSSATNLCEPIPDFTSRSSRTQVNDSILRTLSAVTLLPCNDRSDFTHRSCAAVASNVIVDSKAFSQLESMEALRLVFETIGKVRELFEGLDDEAKDRALSGNYVVEQLMGAVVKHGSLIDEMPSRRLEGLYTFLGGRPFTLNTIMTGGNDYASIVQAKDSQNLPQIQDMAVANLIGVLSGDGVTLRTSSLVAEILGGLAVWEKSRGSLTEASNLSPRLVKALNEKDDMYFQRLAEWITCRPSTDIRPEDDSTLKKMSTNFCSFITYAVGATRPIGRKQAADFKGARIIFDILIESTDRWLWLEPRVSNDIMSLLFVLGARYNTLHIIGSRLLSIMKKGAGDGEEKEYAVPVERFFRFIRDLDRALAAASITNLTSLPSNNDHGTDDTDAFRSSVEDGQSVVHGSSANTVPDACSYVRQRGFHQQYWYNCYTCNLVWDKGCCTLCALRCHQDHDVSYSRYSSFFCDCGGEAPTDGENRVPCKCLNPIDSREAEGIFEGQRWPVIDQFPEVPECPKSDTSSDPGSDDELYTLAIAVASSALEQQSRSSLKKLKEQAETQTWTKELFEALRKSQNHLEMKTTEQVVLPESVDVVMSSPARSVKDRSVVPSAHGRRGKVLKLRKLDHPALLPIRGVRSGTFKLSLSNDSTSDRMKRSTLAKNGVRRQAIVIDSRGRMIVSEPCSLLFCSALPPINVRYEDKSSELPFGRGQMSVLGSTPMSFGIVGMELCRENERHLLAWGTGEASVLILAKSCHEAERKIELKFDLESDEVDFVIKCKWIPGSQTMVAVICGLSVKIFDIRQAEGDKVTSVVSYTLAYEALLRDAALVPTSGTTTSSADHEPGGEKAVSETVKLYLLLDIGQVLDLVLRFDENGLQEQGDMYIESGEGMSLPVGGVRVNSSSQPASTGSMTRSLGEGSSLTYLAESSVLLYACTSSPVLALLLDDRGNVSGSFELLPYIVKSEVLGTGSDGYCIHGPYTAFTQLGYVECDSIKYFRIVCLGKSSRTTQAKILCVDYNENAVRVKEIAWSGAGGIPGMSMTSSFDGLAAFSAPILKTAVDANANFRQSDFMERAYVCAIASSGAMVMFGEEIPSISPLGLTTAPGTSEKAKPSFPLTLFEKLVNVSDSENLVFSGDRIGSSSDQDGAKLKLSPNNSSYFMCPSREGCTITVSLQNGNAVALGCPESVANHDMLTEHSICKSMKNQLVIVALRLLVGTTTTEFIPKYISVEGRRVWLQPDLKKHYDLPLTVEEIASALRNGFVTLGIGPSFDSGNNPLLDSVEVYAARREQISHWLPLTCSHMRKGPAVGGDDAIPTEMAEQLETPAKENRLALNMTSISHLLQVLPTSSGLSPEANETIRQVIQTTALKDGGALRQSLNTMLSCIEADPCRQKMMLDEGVLAGVLKDLRCANEILASTAVDRWNQVRETTKNCLRVAATVAGERPGSYKSVVETLLQTETEASSLAVTAASIVSTGLEGGFEWQDLVPELVELSLTESLLFPGRNEAAKEIFASFDVLAALLASSDNETVKECCKSILDYWVQNLSRPAEPVVSYQCDACSLFPIKGVRYTFPDGGSPPGQETDIDLCSDCFSIGRDFAAQHRYDSGINVKIKGKTIGKSTKLSCSCLGQMKRVAIPASWLVDADKAVSQDSPKTDDSHSAITELENFSSVLFIDLVGLLSNRLEEEKLDFSLAPFQSLVGLVLDLVRNTNDESIMLSRAKELAESILTRIPRLIGLISTDSELEVVSRSVLTVCMKGLASLVGIKNGLSGRSAMANNLEECSVEDITSTKSKDKTDPRFVCEVHGVPAVRRRCSYGEHRNRRFYVCGMDRTCRCGYFKWADAADDERLMAASEEGNCKYSDEIGRFIWGLLNKMDEGKTQSTCVLLRDILEFDTCDQTIGAGSLSDDDCTELVGTGGAVREKTRACPLSSIYDRRVAASDYVDGVFCAQEKFKLSTSQNLLDDSSRDDSAAEEKDTLFTIALDLLSYVADASLEENNEQHERESSGWLPLLCQVSSTSKSPRYRTLAKRALKRFCGGKREIYQSIRDHYVFAFQFRKLLRAVQPALEAGLIVKEQARQCGINWRTGRKATFTSLPVGGLIGTNDLISEDCVTISRGKTIGSTLDQLLSIAKTRGNNWRNFCGLETLPSQSTKKKSSGDGTDTEIDSALQNVSPVISLFWIASVLPSKNQIKILRLIDIALSTQPPPKLSGSAQKVLTPVLESSRFDALLSFCAPSSFPEDLLLEGDKALLANELHAFAIQFVVDGNSAELRKGAAKVVRKLCEKFEDDDFGWLFAQLTNRAFSGLPELGATCNELLRLLQTLAASDIHRISSSPLLSISRNVVDIFTSQLRFMSHGKSTEIFPQQGDKVLKGPSEEDYDFTSCVHCQRARTARETSNATQQQQSGSSIHNKITRASRSISTLAQPVQDSAMLPEQIRPFSRESLDDSTDATLSTEFSTYVQLKCRLAVSDIHVSIGDPRGRYVKSIAVYFSPRHVSDANVLKSDGYADKWQRCATILLPRGATRASCSISPPIIAANLRIHYEEFYERPGGSRADDGSPILHCPRCTRVVSNAHGVCGHCGEVAFQCRKCRHINYLSLDAFLCVECGYCSTASFSYELTCGAASNAVAVMDDHSYQRSIKVIQEATKLREELRSALDDRLRPSSGKRSLSINKYGPSLKQTFLGELPRIRKEKKESVNPPSSSSRDENASTASNRARSLLRLARQLRGDASSDRSRVGDLLMRQSLLGATGSRGISIEDMDELDSDVVGFLSGDLEGSDPLSRLVASIQGRQSSRSSVARDVSNGGEGVNPSRSSASGNDNAQEGTGETTEASSKATTEECDRLYQLMREAERECHELRKRINAWKRLENDALADLGTADSTQSSFSPSECSSCGGPLAKEILLFFMALFESNSEVVQSTITQNFVQALFDESVAMMNKGLFDAKRAAIVALATKSEIASKLILEHLRVRLKGYRDSASAEIMGKIIAVDSPLGEGFVELAEEILASGY